MDPLDIFQRLLPPAPTSASMHRTGSDLINDAKSRIREISPAEVQASLATRDRVVLLDVRERNEFALGHLPGAVHIPRGYLELKVEAAVPRDVMVVVYCAAGVRSVLATDTLLQLGYANAVSLAGGFREWAMSGGTVEG